MTELLLMPKAVMTPDQSRNQREELAAMCKASLVANQDFGIIPGTDKPTLLQPGADKLLNFYGLTSRTVCVEKVENWDRLNPFFMYRYKCSIIWPRTLEGGSIREETIAECEGSANSMESKYAGRWMSYDALSESQKRAADEGKLPKEERAEWVIDFAIKELPAKLVEAFETMRVGPEADRWKSKPFEAKSGKKFTKWLVPGQTLYQVTNEKIFDQVNTLQKMAQKRAYVGATIKAVKASDLYTQDMEDLADHYQAPATTVKTEKKVEVVEAEVVTPQGYAWVFDLDEKGKISEWDEEMSGPLDWLKHHLGAAKGSAEVEALMKAAKLTLDEAGYNAIKNHADPLYKAWKLKEKKSNG